MLRENNGEKPHWGGAEKVHYRNSDAEVVAKQGDLDYTRCCPLYLEHRVLLLSHCKDWPDYQAGGPNPREAARALLDALAGANDARLAAFAAYMHSNDHEHLAHLLPAPEMRRTALC